MAGAERIEVLQSRGVRWLPKGVRLAFVGLRTARVSWDAIQCTVVSVPRKTVSSSGTA